MAHDANAPKLTRRDTLKALGASTAIAAGSLAAPAIIRTAAAADPIKVGVISPLTGAWTVYGKAHSAGFQLAVDEINAAGGVLGRPLEVIIGDSKTEPRIVVEQANRLIRQERVDFLAGTFSSAERNAAGPVVTAANKILLYPTFYEGQEQGVLPRRLQQEHLHVRPRADPAGVAAHGTHGERTREEVLHDRIRLRVAARDQPRHQAQSSRSSAARWSARSTFHSTRRSTNWCCARSGSSGADIIFHSLTGSDTVNFRQQFAAAGMKQGLHPVDGGRRGGGHLGPRAGSVGRATTSASTTS